MNNKLYQNKYSLKGNIIYNVKVINQLIDNANIQLAQKIINDLIDDYPDDYGLLKCQARIYMVKNQVEDALKYYEMIPEDLIFSKKIIVYLILKDDENIKRMYEKYYKIDRFENLDDNYSFIKYQIYGYLGIPLDVPYSTLTYGERQRYSYLKESALEHIRMRHTLDNFNQIENVEIIDKEIDEEIEEKGNSWFNPELDIEDLFDEIHELIINNIHKVKQIKNISQYVIKYPNVGLDSYNNYIDYIFVYVSPGTDNILTMFPVNSKYINYIDDNSIIKKYNDNSLNKVRKNESRIEKFNRKYKLN